MAKGRKVGSSRHERLLGSFGYNQGQGTGTDVSELGEEDVWSMIDRDDHVGPTEWRSQEPTRNVDRTIRNRRWIAREDHHHVGGLSLAFEDAAAGRTPSTRIVHQFNAQDNMGPTRGVHMAASAPMNVPNWSKVLRVDSVESLHDSDDGREEEEEDHDLERVPPHEYLAREYERRRKTSATSLFEGVGRTLKGRDMSRVRDAVWSQTGFDG